MYSEPVLISALAHYSYCPRRCALIHVESLFDENLFTLRGTHNHERADQPITRSERGKRIERALPIWSDQHGLVGRADVVEWHGNAPYPVEYKSGKPKNTRHGAYQLCAQAMCLEEMTGAQVPEGALFYFEPKERVPINFDVDLRREVLDAVAGIRHIIANIKPTSELPPPVADNRCRNCSLLDACMPFAVSKVLGTAKFDLYNPMDEVPLP